MKYLRTFAVLLLSMTASAYASSGKYLDSYDMIKNHLLKGGNIKVILDNKTDCKLVSQTGPIPFSPNAFSFNVDEFNLKAKNGNIFIHKNTDLNAPEQERNIPPNYHNVEMIISPQGEITIEETAISLIDYKVVLSFVTSCVIGSENRSGVKFIPSSMN